jgi:hypothetical protein
MRLIDKAWNQCNRKHEGASASLKSIRITPRDPECHQEMQDHSAGCALSLRTGSAFTG